jgi:predicted DCC family thiol-disulfide oxidoreductase YuxK
MPGLAVLFDGHCALCSRSATRVRRFDSHGRIEFVDLDDASVPQRFPQIDRAEAMKWMLAIDPQGRIYKGADAWVQIGLLLPGWNFLAWILLVPGIHWFAANLYAWIARNRYRWNRTVCNDESCRIHLGRP